MGVDVESYRTAWLEAGRERDRYACLIADRVAAGLEPIPHHIDRYKVADATASATSAAYGMTLGDKR